MIPETQDATQTQSTGRTSVSMSAKSSWILDKLVAEANVARASSQRKRISKKQALDALILGLSQESTVHTLTIL